MPTVTYSFNPDTTNNIWVLDKTSNVQPVPGTCNNAGCGCGGCGCQPQVGLSVATVPAVVQGYVVRVRIDVVGITPTTTIKYDVRIGNSSGTKQFSEGDLFATLAEAMAAYQAYLTPSP